MNYRLLIKNAIDLHVHIGPEIIPRKYNLQELIIQEEGKISGIGVKSHFYPTVAISRIKNSRLRIIRSVTLNNYIGGLNPEIIRASTELAKKPIIVWFPTINAQNFLEKSDWEIRPEWVNNPTFKARAAKNVKGIKVTDGKNKITKKAMLVLDVVKEYNCILATGHISWQEAEILVENANKMGIKRIIITHPIYQLINMPIKIQKKLAKMGAYIEQCYSMYSIDRIPMAKIAKQIKEIGSESCILSSDTGQVFSRSPSECLLDFIRLLEKEGLQENDFYQMLVKNPRKLITY